MRPALLSQHRAPQTEGDTTLPLVGVFECCVDGVAQRAHDAAAGTALEQGTNHVLLAQLARQVQSCQPLMAQVVQASRRGFAQELEGGDSR